MLYLEDYLEMIENLPMEMRERFTDMREADLEVHNTVDQLDERVADFFIKCARGGVKKELRDEQFAKLKAEYLKAVEQSDDKIQIANQVSEMVERHVRRLEGELLKFKMELEADNAGITEVLEKRSLELDSVPKENNPPREKRKYNTQHTTDKRMYKNQSQDVHTTVAHSPESGEPYSPLPTPINQYNIVATSAQSNPAIRAAASQAIAATQQNMPGRRSTSLKASIELASRSSETWPVDSLASSTGSADMQSSGGSRSQRVKKPSQKAEELIKAQQAKRHPNTGVRTSLDSTDVKSPIADAEAVIDDGQVSGDWNADPNEPRYCLCNQISYGEMVGCDNKDCPLEWFHYGCVGLTSAPKGKWYCPRCLASMKRRSRK